MGNRQVTLGQRHPSAGPVATLKTRVRKDTNALATTPCACTFLAGKTSTSTPVRPLGQAQAVVAQHLVRRVFAQKLPLDIRRVFGARMRRAGGSAAHTVQYKRRTPSWFVNQETSSVSGLPYSAIHEAPASRCEYLGGVCVRVCCYTSHLDTSASI